MNGIRGGEERIVVELWGMEQIVIPLMICRKLLLIGKIELCALSTENGNPTCIINFKFLQILFFA